MINSKIKIEYFDQNEDFAQYLPKAGQITKQLTDEFDNKNWFLIQLDEPFKYQLKTGKNFQFKVINCDKLLIRSRIKDQEINSSKGTSVFIMLIPDETRLLNTPIKINDFYNIAWGNVKLITKQST